MWRIKHNNTALTDKGVALLTDKNLPFTTPILEDVEKRMIWVAENCENVTDMALECAMQYYYYNIAGIFNSNIENKINDTAQEMAEKGIIQEW